MSTLAEKARKTVPAIVLTGLAALLLCTWAIVNGYPLVYPDTGTYISSAFRHYVPIDRSVVYSMFLRRMSFDSSLWLTVFAQSLLAAITIRCFFQQFLPAARQGIIYLATIAVLVFTTAIAVNTGQLIADIFTPLAVLSFIMLLFSRGLTRSRRVFRFVLLVIFLPMHFSNFPLLGMLFFVAFVYWFFRLRKKNDPAFGLKEIGLGFTAICGSAVFLVGVNFSVDENFSFRPQGSHVFTMQRLIHCGIISDYLEKKCPDAPPALCESRSYIQAIDFLWDSKNSPVYKNGKNWMDHKEEYDRIISEVFREPQYIKRFAYCSMRDTWKQLFHFNISGLDAMGEGSAPHGEIKWHYKKEEAAYLDARQQKGRLDLSIVSGMQIFVFAGSALIILLILLVPVFRQCLSAVQLGAGWLILAAYLFNAFTCVTFAVTDDRFSARLAWLFPMLLAVWMSDRNVREKITGVFRMKK
ncbi:MAG: hypothetical protein FD123_1984 [Bacteroidetes bacterium]|nr:MAG: hypothetical protein FD123_1984 [Bacteroidota bacterium]